jgi:hypothetical protein
MLPLLPIVALVGCSRPATPSAPVNDPWVGVVGLTWDQRDEEKEITELFKTNGIESAGNGSIRAGISVHQSQVGLALALLKTNHLVVSGKVVLLKE